VDHLAVYGLQYLLLWLFFWSEVWYVKQDVTVRKSSRTVHSIMSVFLVLNTLVSVIVAAYRLVDDSTAVWRDGMEASSLNSVGLLMVVVSDSEVAILFLQIYSIRRNVDHIYLFTFWTLRLLALSMDVAFDRAEWYDSMHLVLAFAWLAACGIYSIRRNVDHIYLFTFWTLRLLALSMDVAFDRAEWYDSMHLVLAFAWLAACGVRAYRSELHDSSTASTCTRRRPNFIRRLFFSWMDHTYREAHRGSAAFYDGTLFRGTLPDKRKCETLLELYEKANAARGYTAVDDGSGRMENERCRFTIGKLLTPFRGKIILTGVNRFVLISLYFLCPYLLRLLLEENQSRAAQKWIVTALFDASIIIAILNTRYQHITHDIGLRIRSILMGAIYRAILHDGTTAHSSSDTLTGDTAVFVPFVQQLHMMWSAPLIIIVTFAALWVGVIGPSGMVGLSIIVAVIVLTRLLAKRIALQEKHITAHNNDRVRLTTASIEQMQQIKSDLMEELFEQRIGEHRRAEVRHMQTYLWYDALKYLLSIATPMIVACGTFLFMYLVGSGPLLTVQSMFVAIALFGITRYPMAELPNLMTHWGTINVKLQVINEIVCSGRRKQTGGRMQGGAIAANGTRGSFEKMQEVVHTFVDQLGDTIADTAGVEMLRIERGQFSNEKEILLRDINLTLRAGTFTAVSGTHGSGKTTLLRAMIGRLQRTAGVCTIAWNRVAYCPQTPWIHSGTIRSNIVFGQEYEPTRYEQVLRACCLEDDLRTFPDLDERVVSEGGHSLSGGQARRVSLARAVYRQADVYLFDDPLRSLDPNVSRKVFENVFHRQHGLLAGSTCVFISHDPEHLAVVDRVLVMSGGTIDKVLTPSEVSEELLVQLKGPEDEQEPDAQLQPTKRVKQNKKLPRRALATGTDHRQGKVSLGLYVTFARMLKARYCVGTLCLEGLVTALDILIITLLAQWASSDKQTNTALLNTTWILCIWVALIFFKTALIHWGGLKLSKLVHSQMLATILRQPMEFFDRNDSGVIVNRFSNDLKTVDKTIITSLRLVLSSSFSVLGTLMLFVYKLHNKPLLFALAFAAALLLVCGLKRLLSYHLQVARTLKRFEASSRSPIILQYNETVQGIDTIKAYGAEERFLRQFLERVDTHQNYMYHNRFGNRWIGVRLEFIGAMVIYYVALLTVSNQSMVGFAFVGIIVSYVLRLIPSLNSLLLALGALEENIISFERVAEYLDLPRETNDATGVNYPTAGVDQQPVLGPIQYRDVSLTHADGSTVLHSVTLTIGAGEKLGIVGRTGSGKSSFIGTLFRFYAKHTTGSICIANVELNDISLRKLRGELTLVPQSTSLLSGLVQNFIDPRNKHTGEQLNRCLRECGLGSVSLATPLENLSVGQCQLLCLVRGLLRKKPIIILDEATSALDEETEDLILQLLDEQFHDRTVLMIAHHLNTVRSCDRILWLQDGRVRKIAPLQEYTVEERAELGFRD
uniref:Uncharacterized protein n=1 Tax=Anopheles christyi TaxID=43041 RepID=A0A182K3R2_9DIPT